MNPIRIAAIVSLTLTVAGCGMLPNHGGTAARSITVAYEDVDGTVKFRTQTLDAVSTGPARLLCDNECIEWLQAN